MVAITFGPTVLTEHNSLVLVRQLLLSFLTGYGISIAVSLIWFPTTSRSVFLAGSKGFLDSCEKLLREERCLFGCVMSKKGDEAVRKKQLALKSALLKGLAMEMLGSMARLREELEYAKQEIALGVYTGDDLGELLRCLEGLMIPILGLSKILSLSGLVCSEIGMNYAQKNLVKDSFRALRGPCKSWTWEKRRWRSCWAQTVIMPPEDLNLLPKTITTCWK
jgi:hypothetical protein